MANEMAQAKGGKNWLASLLTRSPVRRAAKVSIEDDRDFINHVKHTMRPKEKLMQWIARTLISREQAFAMTKDELTARVKLADEHNAADGVREPKDFFHHEVKF